MVQTGGTCPDAPALVNLGVMKLIIASILVTACVSCDRPGRETRLQHDTPAPEEKVQGPALEEANEERDQLLQQQAESFFQEFSTALSQETAEVALAMVAEEHRERFQLGYQLWRGTRFLNPVVKRASEDQTVIEVEVTHKNGRRTDREIKSLRLDDDNWQLLDS